MRRWDILTGKVPLPEFEIPFGALRGKKLKEVPKGQLLKFSFFVTELAHKKNKPIRGVVKETLDSIDQFLWGENS